MDSFPCPYCLGTVPGGSDACPFCGRDVEPPEDAEIVDGEGPYEGLGTPRSGERPATDLPVAGGRPGATGAPTPPPRRGWAGRLRRGSDDSGTGSPARDNPTADTEPGDRLPPRSHRRPVAGDPGGAAADSGVVAGGPTDSTGTAAGTAAAGGGLAAP